MLKLETLTIENIGPIHRLEIKFNPSFNVICGKNGIGKTTILDSIAQTFSSGSVSLKKSAATDKGKWISSFISDDNFFSHTITIDNYDPNATRFTIVAGLPQYSKEIIVFKLYRDFPYQNITSINSDPKRDDNQNSSQTFSGVNVQDIKSWFVNRHLYSKHENHLEQSQIENYELAKECFGLLSDDITFSKISNRTNDIMLHTPTGEIYFEYLSSGYKSCVTILIGLIKEIEYRFINPGINATDYQGVVIIDELELHLHPEFQARIYLALKKVFPKAQIIISTHSPHIIQVAAANEIIALTLNDKNQIKINPLINEKYGCQGWTVEEILQDVMEISETRTDLYLDAMKHFDTSVDNDNYQTALKHFNVLDEMLHPESSLRKILKIQLIGLSDND